MDSLFVETPELAQLRRTMPIALSSYSLAGKTAGLVIVDEVNGFATVGAGALAPPVANPQVDRMVSETDRLARAFLDAGRPVFAFQDCHEPGKPEPPYPPHCERGTGEEDLVPALSWLSSADRAMCMPKDCINGFVGAIAEDGSNRMTDWVTTHNLDTLIVVGICTDICVMDYVLTMLSVRNHGLAPGLTDIVVYEPGCSTFDLTRDVVNSLGLPETSIHPQAETHHMGLYFMASRGAILAERLED